MAWQRPAPVEVWKAIEAYLAIAYPGAPSATVATRVLMLRSSTPEDFYESPALERTPKVDPTRYDLRLGNPWYPHMKFVIERAPDGLGHLYRVDAHDCHIQPTPGSRDYEAFRELMERNRQVAGRIEGAWEARGLPTFKAWLRNDLARRRESDANASP